MDMTIVRYTVPFLLLTLLFICYLLLWIAVGIDREEFPEK